MCNGTADCSDFDNCCCTLTARVKFYGIFLIVSGALCALVSFIYLVAKEFDNVQDRVNCILPLISGIGELVAGSLILAGVSGPNGPVLITGAIIGCIFSCLSILHFLLVGPIVAFFTLCTFRYYTTVIKQ